jgi:hypothetical protein
MSIWECEDRQAVKWFASRPSYSLIHDIFIGKRARKPRKGDRVIRRFKPTIIRSFMSREAMKKVGK